MPEKAISMQQDQEGFLYPFVEISKCIDCKLCDSACPIENKIESKMFDRKAYVLRARKMNLSKIHHIAIIVSDYEAAKNF